METAELKKRVNEMPVSLLRGVLSVDQFVNLSRMFARSYADYMMHLYTKGLRAWEDELDDIMYNLEDDDHIIGVDDEVVAGVHELGSDIIDALSSEKFDELHGELLDQFHYFLDNEFDKDEDDEEAE